MARRYALLLAMCAASFAATAEPVLEAYVSPPSIFPRDGKFPPGGAKAYKPFPAYASVDGALIGHVDTNYVKCGAECENVTANLVTTAGKRLPLAINLWDYATQGLQTYEAPTIVGNVAWSRIPHPKGEFWIKTPLAEIHPFEKLAMFADGFDTVCTKPGNCQPVTPAMRKHIKELPFNGCFEYPYEVQKVVTFEGKRYYEVKLQEIELGKIKLQIPLKGFVPTRNKNGTHTGIHEPQGC
jgi:hypothetical protein